MIGLIRKCWRFLRRYSLRHPLYVLTYAAISSLPNARIGARYHTMDELARLLESGKSLIRLGDGEINLLLGLGNPYQAYSPRVRRMIHTVITRYRDDIRYVLAIPRFVNMSNRELRSIGKLRVWMPLKAMFLLLFPKRPMYADAHAFYYDRYFERFIAPLFVERAIVLITKKETIERQRENVNLPWKNVHFIEAPATNTLDAYDSVKGAIDELLKTMSVENAVLLFALGSAGKYLQYEYVQQGYQCIDIGKVAEVMYTGEPIQHLI